MKNVNTNAELKSLANPKHGDVVHVTASCKELINKNVTGGGIWVYSTEPICEIVNSRLGYDYKELRRAGQLFNVEVTPLTRSIPTHFHFGFNCRTQNNTILGLRLDYQRFRPEAELREIPKGVTNIGYVAILKENQVDEDFIQSVQDAPKDYLSEDGFAKGDKLYPFGDDVTYITPNYESFDGHGYWYKLVASGSLTPQDAGGNPTSSKYDDKVDCHKAIQKIWDNIEYNVEHPIGYYYISKGLIQRRSKTYKSNGCGVPEIYVVRQGRDISVGLNGIIWTDKNIDVVTQQGCNIKGNINLDCQEIPYHTKYAHLVDEDYIGNKETGYKLVVRGNGRTLCYKEEVGTTAFGIDTKNQKKPINQYTDRGTNYFSSMQLSYKNVKCGVYISEKTDIKQAHTNGLKIDFFDIDFAKQHVVMERGISQLNLNYLDETIQLRQLLPKKASRIKPAFKLQGKVIFNAFPMDFKEDKMEEFWFKNGTLDFDWREPYKLAPKDWKQNIVDGEYSFTNKGDVFEYKEMWGQSCYVEIIGTHERLHKENAPILINSALRTLHRRTKLFKGIEFLAADYTRPLYKVDEELYVMESNTDLKKME